MYRGKAAPVVVDNSALPNIKVPPRATSNNAATIKKSSGSDDGDSSPVYSHRPYSAKTLAVPLTPLLPANGSGTPQAALALFGEQGTTPTVKVPTYVTPSNDASTEEWSGSDDGELTRTYSHQPYSAKTLAIPLTPLLPANSGTSQATLAPANVEILHPPRDTEKSWSPIPTECIPYCHTLETFPAGFSLQLYDQGLTTFFEVPSEWVRPTYGSIRFIEDYNEVGPYSRFRFQLCHSFMQGLCHHGFACSHVHALQLPIPQEIHIQGVDLYERLPSGMTFFVHGPNAVDKPQMIPSEYIIRTEGSDRLVTDSRKGRDRPQHCAHFQFKNVCNLGANCAFIHSLVPIPYEAL